MPASQAQIFFETLRGSELLDEEISERNFFGFRSLVIRGKSFVILFEDSLVIKLDKNSSERALALKDSARWNPFGREKKLWIVMPEASSAQWNEFIEKAGKFILSGSGE